MPFLYPRYSNNERGRERYNIPNKEAVIFNVNISLPLNNSAKKTRKGRRKRAIKIMLDI